MHTYQITYTLTDAQQRELEAIVTACNQQRATDLTPEGLLETILTTGSAHMIDERLSAAWDLLHITKP